MRRILTIAAVIYLVIAMLTYHPDQKLVMKWASLGGWQPVNIYQVTAERNQEFGFYNYPPVHYGLDKASYYLARVVGGTGFDEWLQSPNDFDVQEENLSRYSLAMKLPLILAMLGAGIVLFKIIERKWGRTKANWALGLWLFNPISLYAVGMMGQNDVWAILLFLLGWWQWEKNKKISSGIWFGLAVATKTFPLLWVIFLLLNSRRKWQDRLMTGGITLMSWGLIMVPFVGIDLFRQAVLSSEMGSRFTIPGVMIWSDESLRIALILLMILVGWVCWWRPKNNATNQDDLLQQSQLLLVLNLTILGFSHFHVQWYLWVVLFWAMWLVNLEKKQLGGAISLSLISIGAWSLVTILFNDASLTWGMLRPMNANLDSLPAVRDWLVNRGGDFKTVNDFAHTWLAGLGVIGLIGLFARGKQKEQ